MANQKLSQLPAAAALTGAEILPVVQAGQTCGTTTAAVADLRKGVWQAPALNAPWTNFGDAFANAAYRKDGSRVQLRGLVKGGTVGTAVLILPAGSRPPAQHVCLVASEVAVPRRVDVKVNGEVLVASQGAGNVEWLSLDGIAFYVD